MLDSIRSDVPMEASMNVSVGERWEKFVAEVVAAGRYGSASEVVRAGLRLLQEHEAKVKALEAALIEGEESGEPQPFDSEAFLARMHAKYDTKHGN